MFNNLGWGEMLVLLLLGLLVFGPDQLPKVAADLGRMIRQLRRMATDVSSDLRSELGPEFDDVDLASLHPRRFIEKHLLADDDDLDDVPRRSGSATGSDQAPVSVDEPETDGAAERARSQAGSDVVPPYDADAT